MLFDTTEYRRYATIYGLVRDDVLVRAVRLNTEGHRKYRKAPKGTEMHRKAQKGTERHRKATERQPKGNQKRTERQPKCYILYVFHVLCYFQH